MLFCLPPYGAFETTLYDSNGSVNVEKGEQKRSIYLVLHKTDKEFCLSPVTRSWYFRGPSISY